MKILALDQAISLQTAHMTFFASGSLVMILLIFNNNSRVGLVSPMEVMLPTICKR
jgi:hypothetical protein